MLQPRLNNRIPSLRVRAANDALPNRTGQYVLYWMIANRRATWNYSLDRAVDWARELGKPLMILEPLRCDYRWASDRFHAFVIQGMVNNEQAFARQPVTYYPFVEPAKGAGTGLLQALANRACVVVTDDFPCFFIPAMVRAAARQVRVRFELVDSNGIVPMRAADKEFARAFDFRRFLQSNLREWLLEAPAVEPFVRAKLPTLQHLPPEVARRWPRTDISAIVNELGRLAKFPIDHEVPPSAMIGGEVEAHRQLKQFIDVRLARYADKRSEPSEEVASGLSPYLHFGNVSAHEILSRIIEREEWSPERLSSKANGRVTGWWGMSRDSEAFLDELITWRELGYNFCSRRRDYDRYESLPDWAQATLVAHAGDPRPHEYTLSEFESADTHDLLWNAAQRQLVRDGRIHNYLRMLWGKKILEWSASPQQALEVMIELNNKYALDGRDPNSYSGIFWVLGRFDRPWGPRRPIFGTVRYMSSENTARKFDVKRYVAKYS